MRQGKVYLVGAGPGDPGLITRKGLECLQQANVVIYDRLVDESILDEMSPLVEKIYVGKDSKHDARKQEAINRLLMKKAQEGKIVVRLKGGDPFVFGRGGEEAEFLVLHSVPFEVVPGVSSALAVPAYAGIPVTHRRLASSFAVVTGHEADDKDNMTIAWDRLSTASDTLIILMGMANLVHLVDKLIENHRPPSTPVAVIAHGTSNRQRCVTGRLEDIVSQVKLEQLEPPAVVVVGEVAKLRAQLRWFDNRPLFGKRILLIRASKQESRFSQLLKGCGALPIEIPVLKVKPVPVLGELDQAVLNLQNKHWLVFTSVNVLEIFFDRLFALNLDVRHLHNLHLVVTNSATANALRSRGLLPDYIPPRFTIKGFLNSLINHDLSGVDILLLWADIPEKELSLGLTDLGAKVQEVVAYRVIRNTEAISECKQMLLAGKIDLITFTSSSTVKHLLKAVDKDVEGIGSVPVACIGPKTAETAAQAGLRVDMVAGKHTIPSLIETLEDYFREGGPGQVKFKAKHI